MKNQTIIFGNKSQTYRSLHHQTNILVLQIRPLRTNCMRLHRRRSHRSYNHPRRHLTIRNQNHKSLHLLHHRHHRCRIRQSDMLWRMLILHNYHCNHHHHLLNILQNLNLNHIVRNCKTVRSMVEIDHHHNRLNRHIAY